MEKIEILKKIRSEPPLITELLSACCHAAIEAGRLIKEVVNSGIDLKIIDKSMTNDICDPQTIADRKSQKLIIESLKRIWPELCIIGEEDDIDQNTHIQSIELCKNILKHVEYKEENLPKIQSLNNISLWVDPLDGTKKFTAKAYDQVSVLIGIAYCNRPIAGIIHEPFNGKNGILYWGIVGLGCYKWSILDDKYLEDHPIFHQIQPQNRFKSKDTLNLITSETPCAIMDLLLMAIPVNKVDHFGATGVMLRRVLDNDNTAYVRLRNGTKRWDTCAGEALIMACGGTVVDKHGKLYEYDPFATNFDNNNGIVASFSLQNELIIDACKTLDILRTPTGKPWTSEFICEWLLSFPGSKLKLDPKNIERIYISPKSLLFGRHSNSGMLHILLKDQSSIMIFLKRSFVKELPDRSMIKWKRDIQSYCSEVSFYTLFYNDLSPFIRLPCIYATHSKINMNKHLENQFMIAMEDITSSFCQWKILNFNQLQSALIYLSKLHSFGWENKKIFNTAKEHLWEFGGWFGYPKRGKEELMKANQIWKSFMKSFENYKSHEYFKQTHIQNLSQRMITHAPWSSEQLHSNCDNSKTLIHGDFKTANLFFKDNQVLAIDWQWCGTGYGAMDVAYLLWTSADITALENKQEMELLEFYYKSLLTQIQIMNISNQSIEKKYSFKQFYQHYVFACIEYGRVALSYFWMNTTPESCLKLANSINKGLVYRSIPHALRFIEKLDIWLQFIENERKSKHRSS